MNKRRCTLFAKANGVDGLQAGFLSEAIDLVKEICQTCDWNATIRVHVTNRGHLG